MLMHHAIFVSVYRCAPHISIHHHHATPRYHHQFMSPHGSTRLSAAAYLHHTRHSFWRGVLQKQCMEALPRSSSNELTLLINLT